MKYFVNIPALRSKYVISDNISKLGRKDSNPRISAPKADGLPLADYPKYYTYNYRNKLNLSI